MLRNEARAAQGESKRGDPAGPAEAAAALAALRSDPLLQVLLNAADVAVVMLDRQRQVLVGDAALLGAAETELVDLAEGLRLGDVLGCVHADAGSCGDAPECGVCGAALTRLESRPGSPAVERECLMTVRRGDRVEAMELHVRAFRTRIAGEEFTIVGLRDISAAKRREALERVFIHDMSNTVGSLSMSAQVLTARVPETEREVAQRVFRLAERLRRDLDEQRLLLEAEKGTLEVNRGPVRLDLALEAARAVLDGGPEAKGRSIELERKGPPLTITTDESLLVRVLVNMMKNALEATAAGGTIKAWAEATPEGPELRVWNAGVMPSQVALRVFKRSFTTKPSPGRGLGTFSIKLFGERYLGGVVGFTSSLEGTTFFIRWSP